MGKRRLGIWGLAKDHQGGSDPEGCEASVLCGLAWAWCATTLMGSSPPPFSKAGTEAREGEGPARSHTVESARGFWASTVRLLHPCAARNDPGMVPLKA